MPEPLLLPVLLVSASESEVPVVLPAPLLPVAPPAPFVSLDVLPLLVPPEESESVESVDPLEPLEVPESLVPGKVP
ncbi:MAG TPA: hypothetical protein VM571_12930 [Noviherbaspirillum sp.]|nr:hypothetical protein [Noviherbaspirillum sp.]